MKLEFEGKRRKAMVFGEKQQRKKKKTQIRMENELFGYEIIFY